MEKKIVIIGAGPSGLGAAYRLTELGYKNWMIYEKNNYVGGLSASFVDAKGFTWDIGGHIIFSHYKYFDKLIDKLLRGEYIEHSRKSWIRIKDKWIPYPFQNNIKYLDKDQILECLIGLYECSGRIYATKNSQCHSERSEESLSFVGTEQCSVPTVCNFKEWIYSTFGSGIAKYFMIPYNEKIWATPLELLDKHWIAERISVVNFKRVLENVILDKDDVSWGPNSTFKFPLYGGTGGLFNKLLPIIKSNLKLECELSEIDIEKKTLKFKNGLEDNYEILVNTSPLNKLIYSIKNADSKLLEASNELQYVGAYIVGISIKEKCPSKKCWMYFPESNSPFYRVTYFSNYSPNNVPSGEYYSLMCETSYSEHKKIDKDSIIDETIQGLINTGMINDKDRDKIVSTYFIDAPYAYPIPTIKRDNALTVIQPCLEEKEIYSRGRFGAWKYEVGNMDHSVMQGVEIINRILLNENEKVLS